jgi:hypothetical protein
MQPQQPLPQAPQQPQQNPYDFFMNTPAPQKQSLFTLPGGGGSNKPRILLIAGGGILLLIILIIIMSSFGGNKRGDELLVLAQQQAELIRVADLAKDEPAARGTATQILSANTSLSLNSSQQETVTLIKKAGTKVDAKRLALKQKTSTDSKLAVAAENNTYDQAFKEIIDSQLTAYQNTAKQLYASAKSKAEKQVLSDAYKGAGILLGEPDTN